VPKPVAQGKFIVQVGAFSSRDNAQSAANKVGGGVSAAGKLWRVRMGPFGSDAEAKAALAKAKAAGYTDARIQRAD
jgi:rare lipoprotein A